MESKDKEKEEFKKIMTDPAYKQSLGLTTQHSICVYLKITSVTFSKWQKSLERVDGGDFDIKEFLGSPENKEKLARAALKAATVGGNSKSMETLFKLVGELDKGKEGANKLEYTNNDIALQSERFIAYLREIYERNGGKCPICDSVQQTVVNGDICQK
jgi:hypothetical protein